MTPARRRQTPGGRVALVGAGPGDPDLLTVRALRLLQEADVVMHDGLVPRRVLALAPAATLVSVARRVGPKPLTQAAVNARMIAAARDGKRVVRLKAGDPFVFGRGGEEAEALAEAAVPFEVVPGVTSALAAPLLAGIPVTYREVASAFVVASGHDVDALVALAGPLSDRGVTLVILMGLGTRAALRRGLLAHGWAADTPAAVVVNASQSHQRIWRGRLASLGRADGARSRLEPAVILIGHAVAHATPWD